MTIGKSKAEDGKQSARLPVHVSQQKGHRKSARRDLHKSYIDGLPDGTELHYRNKVAFKGYKAKEGRIFCLHCQKEVSPAKFEDHAGYGHRRQPYKNIVNTDGVSLHTLSLQLLEGKKAAEENDNNCFVCAEQTEEDEEGLIHHRKCRKYFHKDCILLSRTPVDTLKCTYCLKPPGYVTKQTTDQSTTESSGKADIGTCFLCSSEDFDKSDELCSQTIILCNQCGKEYHVGCLKDKGIADLKELPKDEWFCDEKCSRIYQALQDMVVGGIQKLPEPALNRIKMNGVNSSAEPVIRWRILRGTMASWRTRKLFGKAISIFHEAFGFIEDPNCCDLFPAMVYGRSVDNHDFEGMYCALLLVNSEIVSAAIFRIYGEDVAEIPYVATKIGYQGQGYFTALFSFLENLLASLMVKDIVVPVADNAATYWEKKLCFEPMMEDKLKDYRRKYFTLIECEGTPLLHKSVQQSLNCDTTADG